MAATPQGTVLSLQPTLARRPGDPTPSSGLGSARVYTNGFRPPWRWDPLEGVLARRPSWGLARSLGRGGLRMPSRPLRKKRGSRLHKRLARRGAPRCPGGHPEVPSLSPPPLHPRRRERGTAAASRPGGGRAAGPPAGTSSRPARGPPPAAAPPPRAVAGSAARAHWRARGPARGPSRRSGGASVGRRRAAQAPARRRRHRHLAAQAPRDARRVSGAGKSAGAARDPVGGSPPSPQPPEATGQRS